MGLRGQHGYTIIEVLVVMIVLALIAAIAIPRFVGQSEQAKDAEAKTLARNLESHVESCFVEERSYARCDSAGEVPGTGMTWGTDPGEVQVAVNPFGLDAIAFIATSKTGTLFALVHPNAHKSKQRVCLVPSGAYPTGACRQGGSMPGFGKW
jgi:prepilin-type N-terminal cleavage/methylation domain-containing protein